MYKSHWNMPFFSQVAPVPTAPMAPKWPLSPLSWRGCWVQPRRPIARRRMGGGWIFRGDLFGFFGFLFFFFGLFSFFCGWCFVFFFEDFEGICLGMLIENVHGNIHGIFMGFEFIWFFNRDQGSCEFELEYELRERFQWTFMGFLNTMCLTASVQYVGFVAKP